jgi:hypothetical protein
MASSNKTLAPRASVASVTAFPDQPSVKWRREFAECRCYSDALSLAFRMIREMERAERPTLKLTERAKHQLAFPWARVD